MPWIPGLLQRLLHLVELERLDDRLDLLHLGETPHPRAAGRADPLPLWAARQDKRGRRSNSIGSAGSRHRAPAKGQTREATIAAPFK